MSERASLSEVLDFANKVRAAGGGNPIDALMPSAPGEAHSCLIARNLNFASHVEGSASGLHYPGEPLVPDPWSMVVQDEDVAAKIAAVIGSKAYTNHEGWFEIPLPHRIGEVADAFDRTEGIIGELRVDERGYFDAEKRRLLAEFWPYITDNTKDNWGVEIEFDDDGKIKIGFDGEEPAYR